MCIFTHRIKTQISRPITSFMENQPVNTAGNRNPNLRNLLIVLGLLMAGVILWAIFGSLLTGNTPDKNKGTGAVNQTDTSIVTENDTLPD